MSDFNLTHYIVHKRNTAQQCDDSYSQYQCRDQDSNLGCRGHNAKYLPLYDHG